MCSFWIARPPITADPTIKEKNIQPRQTATFFDNHAVRLLKSSVVRKRRSTSSMILLIETAQVMMAGAPGAPRCSFRRTR
jgi:hypothetical protein